MKNPHVLPLGWYLHVAAGAELRWTYAYRVAQALLYQGSHRGEHKGGLDFRGVCEIPRSACPSRPGGSGRVPSSRARGAVSANMTTTGGAGAAETVDSGDVNGLGK